ncbi:MAG: hypothetical protein JST60_10225 [Chloroflexi bacterium SZAS-1]|jgi:uncharacterized coiled-coil DUF342 family protein|nr:hypothetical protein [Chloroflexi bacterium SZAS-1]
MDRRTMIENRLRAARSVTNATADVARSEIDGLHTEFETAFKIAARIDSASDQYIATAFEYGQALKKLKQLQSVTDTEKKGYRRGKRRA